jgi:hypothetical protein
MYVCVYIACDDDATTCGQEESYRERYVASRTISQRDVCGRSLSSKRGSDVNNHSTLAEDQRKQSSARPRLYSQYDRCSSITSASDRK